MKQDSQKPIEITTKTAKRAHAVPGTMLPIVRADVAVSMAAGRNSAQTAKANNTTQAVCIELWMRHELRRITTRLNEIESDLRKAA